MNNTSIKKTRLWCIIFVASLCLFLFMELFLHTRLSERSFVGQVQKSVLRIESDVDESKNSLVQLFDSLGSPSVADFRTCPIPDRVVTYVFQDDSLLYWNSNLVDSRILQKRATLTNDTISNLLVGDFYVSSFKEGHYTVYLLSLLNTTYQIDNDYFVNRFQPFLTLQNHNVVFGPSATGSLPIVDSAGNVLSHVTVSLHSAVSKPFTYVLFLCFLLVVVSFYLLLYRLLLAINKLRNKGLFFCLAYFGVSLLSFVALNCFRPDFLLFTSDLYGETHLVFPHCPLGVFFEIVVLVCANLLVFSSCLRRHRSSLPYWLRLSLPSLAYLLFFFACVRLIPVLALAGNSNLVLQANGFADLNYSMVILICMLLVSSLLFLNSLFSYFSPKDHGLVIPLAIFVPLLFLICLACLPSYWIYWLVGVALFVALYFRMLNEDRAEFPFMALQFGIVAVFLTCIYNFVTIDQENKFMKDTVNDVLVENDTAFISSFDAFSKAVDNDSVLREMIFSGSNILDEIVLGYSQNLLFDSIMRDYDVSLTICSPGSELEVQPDGFVTDCRGYFQNIIASNNGEAVSERLYSIDYNTLDPSYLGIIDVLAPDTLDSRTLYFEFSKSIIPAGFGFPKFLQDKNSVIPWNYSVASYRNKLLVYKYGKNIYPNHLTDMRYVENGYCNDRNLKHYALTKDGKTVILSVDRHSWIERTAPFAIFYFLLLVTYLLAYLLHNHGGTRWLSGKSFRGRLQMILLLTMAISFLVVGPVSVIYMRGIYNKKSRDFHYERTRTIMLDMMNQVDDTMFEGKVSKGAYDNLVRHFSSIFFTDINLYGLDGKLLATSRPEIMDNRLQAPLMNPDAFQNMQGDKNMYYSHDEKLGTGAYQSAYISILDNNGKAVAYLNTPYFSSRTELETEIMNFILIYVNIILLLMVVSVILILGVTKRLTKPLALIQSKMRDVKIDRANEPIEWKSNDEIGELIEQYNQLVAELEKSASSIARSERETAWREMARQVAHEIKNPLTPMRLSVQYLQKAWDEGAPDVDERLRHTTQTLIEQIDTLSDIASAFSNYAKLPEGKPEPVNLAELVGNVVRLYDTEENVKFSYEYDKDQDHTFVCDKNNMSRALGNIVKNAIQAIGGKPDGQVDIRLVSSKQKHVIRITDNGKGISDEEKTKIFMPNFTTKSSGMGVGLSIVYNIIQASGGRITFQSEVGVGTTFVIELFENIES